jgi:L-amino acid N-acyltransferase YncA
MVRAAEPADLAAVAAIYTAGIEGRTATFETRPRSAADVAPWLDDPARFPLLVAEDRGEVVGWVRVSPYSSVDAYSGVGELQVYVDPAARGRGVGAALIDAICRAAREAGYWKLTGKLFLDNEPSRALLRRAGFRDVGVHHRHGRLDGEWRDVLVVERSLGGEPRAHPAEPGASP